MQGRSFDLKQQTPFPKADSRYSGAGGVSPFAQLSKSSAHLDQLALLWSPAREGGGSHKARPSARSLDQRTKPSFQL